MVDVVLELGWLWLCVLMSRESFYLPQQPAMMAWHYYFSSSF
jgi:hypothetical protein